MLLSPCLHHIHIALQGFITILSTFIRPKMMERVQLLDSFEGVLDLSTLPKSLGGTIDYTTDIHKVTLSVIFFFLA